MRDFKANSGVPIFEEFFEELGIAHLLTRTDPASGEDVWEVHREGETGWREMRFSWREMELSSPGSVANIIAYKLREACRPPALPM